MSSTFNRWVPYCGSSTKESANELDTGQKGGSSSYVTRASWLPVYNLTASFTHDETLDYDLLRRNMDEWRKYSHLLAGEFYVLTPWHRVDDTTGWTVFVYRNRHTDESVVEAFRQETCPESTFVARLPFAKMGQNYRLVNEDSGEVLLMEGGRLSSEGIPIHLAEPKSSAVWHVERAD